MTKRSMYPFHSSVARRQRLTEGVSEAWCFKKLFELFDSIIISTFCFTWILEREVQKFKLIGFGLLSYIFILIFEIK